MDAAPPALVFRSRYFPAPRAGYVQALLTTSLAATLTPVLIYLLARALQGYALWPALGVGPGLALAAALGWTAFTLRRRIAEVRLAPGVAAVRTAYEVLGRRRAPAFKPLYDLRRAAASLFISIGADSLELYAEDWPDYERLLRALHEAAAAETAPSP